MNYAAYLPASRRDRNGLPWSLIVGHIHVSEPFAIEQALFGFRRDGVPTSPSAWLLEHRGVILDGICGTAYLTFLWQYVGTTLYLHAKSCTTAASRLAWTFFWLSASGFATYFVYPAAPPWYVSRYGLGPARLHIAADQAGAARFDAIFGTHFFSAWYGMSIDVYGAFPSLHVAYPWVIAYTTWTYAPLRRWRYAACGFCGLMAVSAVYLQHHYVIDVILGVVYAAAVTSLSNIYERRGARAC